MHKNRLIQLQTKDIFHITCFGNATLWLSTLCLTYPIPLST
jgi:hypothetical protein